MDWLFDGLLDFLIPKTPWKLFVRLVVLGALVVAYLIAEDAGSLPWQSSAAHPAIRDAPMTRGPVQTLVCG